MIFISTFLIMTKYTELYKNIGMAIFFFFF